MVRQKLVELVDRMIGDAGEDVGEPGEGIDLDPFTQAAVQLARATAQPRIDRSV